MCVCMYVQVLVASRRQGTIFPGVISSQKCNFKLQFICKETKYGRGNPNIKPAFQGRVNGYLCNKGGGYLKCPLRNW